MGSTGLLDIPHVLFPALVDISKLAYGIAMLHILASKNKLHMMVNQASLFELCFYLHLFQPIAKFTKSTDFAIKLKCIQSPCKIFFCSLYVGNFLVKVPVVVTAKGDYPKQWRFPVTSSCAFGGGSDTKKKNLTRV